MYNIVPTAGHFPNQGMGLKRRSYIFIIQRITLLFSILLVDKPLNKCDSHMQFINKVKAKEI